MELLINAHRLNLLNIKIYINSFGIYLNISNSIGVNLNGVVDWSTQWVFVDLIKQARDYIVQWPEKYNNLRQYVTIMLRDVKQKWPDSLYHVFYDG